MAFYMSGKLCLMNCVRTCAELDVSNAGRIVSLVVLWSLFVGSICQVGVQVML